MSRKLAVIRWGSASSRHGTAALAGFKLPLLLRRRKSHPKKQSLNAYVVFKEEGGVTKALDR